MALMILHSSSSTTSKPCLLLHKPFFDFHFSTKSKLFFPVKSQDSSSEPQPPNEASSSAVAPPKTPNSTGLGFGSSSNANPIASKKKQKQQRVKRERASIIRREPFQSPAGFASKKEDVDGVLQSKEQMQNESAFLLAWLGLGLIILVEGILLAVSGFLPEQWDNFFVKYLYPSFTPTVFLFVAGTVGYAVLKYLQNEKFKSQK